MIGWLALHEGGGDHLGPRKEIAENIAFDPIHILHEAAGFVEKRFALFTFGGTKIPFVFMGHLPEFGGPSLLLFYFQCSGVFCHAAVHREHLLAFGDAGGVADAQDVEAEVG